MRILTLSVRILSARRAWRPVLVAALAFCWLYISGCGGGGGGGGGSKSEGPPGSEPPPDRVAVSRGPYLQLATATTVAIRWRTDVATGSRVAFGTLPGELTEEVEDRTPSTEHAVTLVGLIPDTLYYYAVGTTAALLAGDDAAHFFITAPAPGEAKPTRIWVLGDSGTASSRAKGVRDAYYASTGAAHTDLWLMLGDNAYPRGTDSQYQAAVFEFYPETLRTSPLWPALGNHDGASSDSAAQSGPFFDAFTLPARGEAGGVPSATEAYYSFDHANIHLVCLDAFGSDRSSGGAMMRWLGRDLAATGQTWLIAYWHHPPYTKGSHDSDSERELIEMRENALPILEEGGVDLVLCGHSHSYERSSLLDGHYGMSSSLTRAMKMDAGDGRRDGDGAYRKPAAGGVSGRAPRQGAVYVVSGSSGSAVNAPLDHPAMVISLAVMGSLVLDIDGNTLDATFLGLSGEVLDHFTIVKDVVE